MLVANVNVTRSSTISNAKHAMDTQKEKCNV